MERLRTEIFLFLPFFLFLFLPRTIKYRSRSRTLRISFHLLSLIFKINPTITIRVHLRPWPPISLQKERKEEENTRFSSSPSERSIKSRVEISAGEGKESASFVTEASSWNSKYAGVKGSVRSPKIRGISVGMSVHLDRPVTLLTPRHSSSKLPSPPFEH